MSDVLQTLQKLVQDVIAPDVREIKVRLEELEKRMGLRFDAVSERFGAVDTRFGAVDGRFDAVERQMDANTKVILAAIAEVRAQVALDTHIQDAALSERIAKLESKTN